MGRLSLVGQFAGYVDSVRSKIGEEDGTVRALDSSSDLSAASVGRVDISCIRAIDARTAALCLSIHANWMSTILMATRLIRH